MTVLSIGDESVKNSLKNCLAVGADYAYLAANDAYQSADPEIIAKELKAAKEAIEERTGKKFDIVFCGKEIHRFRFRTGGNDPGEGAFRSGNSRCR